MTGKNIDKHFFNNASKKIRQYFFKRSVGIDISDRSIEVVEIKKDHGKIHVSTNRVLLEAGLVERGIILDQEKLKTKLSGALKGASPTEIEAQDVLFAVPDTQLYTHFFSAAFINQEGLAELVAKEVELNIPLPFRDVIYSFKVLKNSQKDRSGKPEEVVVVAVSRTVIKQWVDFFKELKLQVYFFEIEPAAHYSGILSGKLEQPACIVDLGANVTLISVSSREDLFYTYSVSQGGDSLTQKIVEDAKILGKELSFEQANEMKRAQGLRPDSECIKSIQTFLAPIIKEIIPALSAGEERTGQPIEHLYLIGGTAALIGLEGYLADSLKHEFPKLKVILGQEVSIIEYVEALGLATRGIESGQTTKLILPADLPDKKATSRIAKSSLLKSTAGIQRPDAKDAEEIMRTKNKKQIKILITILIFGVFALGGAFWFKSQRQKNYKPALSTVTQTANFSFKHEIDVEVTLSVNTSTSSGSISQTSGRLLSDLVNEPASYNESVQQSFVNIKKNLATSSVAWNQPIKVYGTEERLVFPLQIDWLSYPEKQVTSSAVVKVGTRLAKQKFLLNNTTIKSVKFDEKTKKATFVITVSVMTDSEKL